MARFSFHLGVHRCASTSLQKHLAVTRGRLPHVEVRLRRELRGCDHRTLRWSTRGTYPSWVAPLAAAAFEGSTRVDRAADYLISDENLLGRMPGRVSRLYPHTDQLATAFDTLRSEGHEVRALLVVREPVALIESCYRFLRGSLPGVGTIDEFLDAFELDSLRWVPVLDPLQRALGGELYVVPFEWMARHPRRYRATLRQFHDAFAGFKLRTKHNASAPDPWLAVSLAAERAGLPLRTPEFRRGGRSFARHPGLLQTPTSTPAAHAAWIAQAQEALARVRVELSTEIVAAGLAGWLAGRTAGHVSADRARETRKAVADEWGELFARFMPPGASPHLWRATLSSAAPLR